MWIILKQIPKLSLDSSADESDAHEYEAQVRYNTTSLLYQKYVEMTVVNLTVTDLLRF